MDPNSRIGGYPGDPKSTKAMVISSTETAVTVHVTEKNDRFGNNHREAWLKKAEEKDKNGERPWEIGKLDGEGIPQGGSLVKVTHYPQSDGSYSIQWTRLP